MAELRGENGKPLFIPVRKAKIIAWITWVSRENNIYPRKKVMEYGLDYVGE